MDNKRTKLEIKGQIERITFNNEENGYTIARMRIQGRKDLITVIGTMYSISPGEVLKAYGYWDNHPKYGEQFRITSYETLLPATSKGIERYLGSGMIKGIGPVMAKRLVSRFKEETLRIIEEDIERLKEVEGIGEKRVEMIKKAWEEQKEIRDVMIFLQGNGVSPTYAVKIYRHYKNDSIRVVRENPYRLAMDIFGIGFKTADKIAEKMGIPKDSQIRSEAGIMHILHELSDDGHVYYPYGPLIEKCCEALDVEGDKIPLALDAISREGKVIIDDRFIDKEKDGDHKSKAVYLAKYHVSETGIAQRLKKLLSTPKQMRLVNIDDAMTWVQRVLRIEFSPKQLEAVRDAIHSKVMIITGGPGTGKTTIIKAIISIYEKMGQRVLLAAPTGRAAKRMTEATEHEAKTIHRLLEYSPSNGQFKKNEANPLDGDLLIIDEASMIDTIMMYHLLKAVKTKTTLIFVGDADQLPSVGAGNTLKDIIDSGYIPTVRLNEIFRQSKESMIIVNAHRVNKGEMPYLKRGFNKNEDFFFAEIEDPEEVVRYIVYLCREAVPSRFGYNPVDDIQVLTPMHKGLAGVANLNRELQQALNPEGMELVRAGKVFRVGDKVMQIRNNYEKDVYNGDIGRIVSIDQEVQEVCVDYDSRIIKYEFLELDEIILAYAISVHKSQGSEYPVIIMPVLTQHYMLLQRNLIYTGITRGKRLVFIVGTKKALSIAIRNNKPLNRFTMLRERLLRD
ncbi:MAG TPA: ATP-dependent RecD-like DNA helicase [Syntrophorhabdaceae bacterium]|nr:ATP-dependent RecD-like DNA helicase [Syntrophorhabdaceae bacterium]HQE80290.1 ATP-dependent RecD-like DNA helicase [Syntrophorhabdaceae bacterium]HQH42467.1 ATP-dependent RecD-like DNA helicase [Syntrophorhabdaceae bacterium]HQK45760.1 ATP-dependent RecD-like DNA helicase [Syntrophorhabdaceae bacterium]HRR71146.1 ATP-dependent RecD-like DNA helicase [Syntrophorhabdaceae bacterium]